MNRGESAGEKLPLPCTCVAGCRPERKVMRIAAAAASHHPTRRKRKPFLSVDKEEGLACKVV